MARIGFIYPGGRYAHAAETKLDLEGLWDSGAVIR